MKKKLLVLVLSAVMAVGMMSGCGAKSDTSDTKAKTAESSSAKEEETEEQTECELEDGTYTAEFKTDSGMFHVNEANDGKGTLTVKDGKMTIDPVKYAFYQTADLPLVSTVRPACTHIQILQYPVRIPSWKIHPRSGSFPGMGSPHKVPVPFCEIEEVHMSQPLLNAL